MSGSGENISCNWANGFVMDPNKKDPVGYLTAFTGLGTQVGALAQDLEVFCPCTGLSPSYPGIAITEERVKAVGIIESITWGGGVGDPWCFSVYISGVNQQKIAAAMKNTFDSTKIDKLSWWVGDFDTVKKNWYERVYPKADDMKGMLNAQGGKMKINLDTEGVKVHANVDAKVFSFYFEVVPAANVLTAINFATGVQNNSVKNWGLKIGGNT
jgi:hypothetical protein